MRLKIRAVFRNAQLSTPYQQSYRNAHKDVRCFPYCSAPRLHTLRPTWLGQEDRLTVVADPRLSCPRRYTYAPPRPGKGTVMWKQKQLQSSLQAVRNCRPHALVPSRAGVNCDHNWHPPQPDLVRVHPGLEPLRDCKIGENELRDALISQSRNSLHRC